MHIKSVYRHGKSSARGSVLVAAMVMVVLASFASLLMARTLLDQQHLNQRRRDLSRAFYAAEAGIQLINYWGLNNAAAATYQPNPTVFLPGNDLSFSNLKAAMGGSGFTITADDLKTTVSTNEFRAKSEYEVATIQKIEILPVTAADLAGTLYEGKAADFLFKAVSTGRCGRAGIERKVAAFYKINLNALNLKLDAALLSFGSAGESGNARIHWGEAWSKMDFQIPQKSQMGNLDTDKWITFRTEGKFTGLSGFSRGVGMDLANLETAIQPGAAPASGVYEDKFYQHLPAGTLKWPLFDYQTFKNQALARGRYYTLDGNGNVYKNGKVVDFLTEFGVANRDTAPYDLAFIDTVDRKDPLLTNTKLATITVSGKSLGLKGVFWIGANLDAGGCGDPPPVTAKDPDGAVWVKEKIFLEGAMYTAGIADLGGNSGVYGSIVTQRGYGAKGTPDIWYNVELKKGLEYGKGNAGPGNFSLVLQRNY
jgi:hypothetical protein